MRLHERRLATLRGPQTPKQDDPGELAAAATVTATAATTTPTSTPKTTAKLQPIGAKALNHRGHVQDIKPSRRQGLKRRLNAINSLAAIKLKMLIFSLVPVVVFDLQLLLPLLPPGQQGRLVEAGFFTFYFPNIFKPKGFGELSDMIHSLEGQINQTKDAYADTLYFWGQLQRLDDKQAIENDYPEESACDEVLPLFRESAIEYTHIDYDFYVKPIELYREHLLELRAHWYRAGLESKAALPREWEQRFMQKELELKIEWLERLVNDEQYRDKRDKMLVIWGKVRRSLDMSVPCIYLRYAYRQMAEDINQVALEANLEDMRQAMQVLVNAYKRIERFKASDMKIIEDIKEELKENERFAIKE